MSDEKTDALKLAERILDRPNADPDDDLAMLARQLIRATERAEQAEALVGQLRRYASHLDECSIYVPESTEICSCGVAGVLTDSLGARLAARTTNQGRNTNG